MSDASSVRGLKLTRDKCRFRMLTIGIDDGLRPFRRSTVIRINKCYDISPGGVNSDVPAPGNVIRAVPYYRYSQAGRVARDNGQCLIRRGIVNDDHIEILVILFHQ